jgi:hypothetical protein
MLRLRFVCDSFAIVWMCLCFYFLSSCGLKGLSLPRLQIEVLIQNASHRELRKGCNMVRLLRASRSH